LQISVAERVKSGRSDGRNWMIRRSDRQTTPGINDAGEKGAPTRRIIIKGHEEDEEEEQEEEESPGQSRSPSIGSISPSARIASPCGVEISHTLRKRGESEEDGINNCGDEDEQGMVVAVVVLEAIFKGHTTHSKYIRGTLKRNRQLHRGPSRWKHPQKLDAVVAEGMGATMFQTSSKHSNGRK
jgi:hypothetical protein